MTESVASTPAADDAMLASLTVSPGAFVPAFWGERRRFAVMLPSSVDAVTVAAQPKHPDAQVVIAGQQTQRDADGVRSATVAVCAGGTDIAVEVTAADGCASVRYEVKAQRAMPLVNWQRLLEHAPFSPRDSEGELVFDGRMWIFGGYTPALVNDVWASADGRAWQEIGRVPDDAGVNIPVCMAHDGRMWLTSQAGRFYSSTDGVDWTLVCERPPWSVRYGAGSAVFKGRMWVVGGLGQGALHNDVWSSSDGVDWTRELEHAPWSPRQVFSNLIVKDDMLYLVGGGVSQYEPFKSYRDVWCSPDGRNWRQVCAHAPWPGRVWTSCAVYRDRIWLLGGFRAQPTWNNFNDLWYSHDGADWRQLHTEDIWSERHEISAYVFDDALWVVAGNAWPLVNDVWRLRIDGLSFVTQPPLEEFADAAYRYAARADFGQPGGAVRYALTEAPDWLSIDPATGLISGRAGKPGDYPVTLEARDPAGERAEQSYTLHVIAV